MTGAPLKAAALLVGLTIFAVSGHFLEKRQQIRRLQEQNAELKREVESMRERLETSTGATHSMRWIFQ